MSSAVSPLLLEKTQAAYLSNTTVRDGFATCRPPFTKNLTINYPSPAVQTAIEEGLYQGATYYKPDAGPESLIAQIGGFLYQFTVVGDVVTVRDISVPGDPNPATATQAWLWQAENFVIVQDGISLPIFFDGATSRRSYGPTQVLGATVGGETIPPFGQSIPVAVTSYTGPFNVPVLIGGFYWQPIENSAGYLVNAESLYDVSGTAIPVDAEVTAKPSIAFVLSSPMNLVGPFQYSTTIITINITAPSTVAINSKIILFNRIWNINSAAGNTVTIRPIKNQAAGTYSPLPAGYQVQVSGSTAPNVVYGLVTVAAVAPAIGGMIQLRLNNVYAGTPGQIVYIGTSGQYRITAVPPPPPGVGTIEMININAPNGSTVPETVPAADIISVPELPAGRMGVYGHSQNWVALVDGLSFIPSDISGSASGTPAYQYRDAVLKTTNITFGSGNFRIPSAGDFITAMFFTTTLDESMGQGPLMIGTERYIFSVTAPIDPSNLAAIIAKGSPILTYALIGRGPLAQNSTISVNSDVQFRSTVGLGSLIIARQQFTSSLNGNTPISEEMVRVLNKDDKQLLPYSSAINFDNRVIFTASPQASSQGVFHTSLVVMNLDGLSSLRGKEPACYDGQWTGLNVLQLTTGMFNGTSRAFAFTFNVSLSKIELYELLPSDAQILDENDQPTLANFYDNGSVPITWSIETASLFNEDVKPKDVLVQLNGGEFAVDELVGTVRFEIFYKPDQYGAYGAQSCWVPWHRFSLCAAAGSKPLYFPRLGLPEPDSLTCVGAIDTPARNGYSFQVRFVITGRCRLLRLRVGAVTQPTPKFEKPTCDVIETVVIG
jgi:hypothetical protein